MSTGVLAGLSAVALGALSVPLHADEAYLCGPDNVIYVSAADLPKMKRTNACVAAYYGLTVEAPAKAASAAPMTSKRVAAVPAPAVKAKELAKPAQVALKPMAAPEPSIRAAQQPVRQAALAVTTAAPVALPGTDYRNVKILNAANPDDAVFRHTK